MDLNFYSDLSDGSGQNVDSVEFLDTQPYSGYSENKFPGGSEHYLTINGAGHFLSAEQTFHTPSLGDEVFEIPPISLDTVVSHFGELSDGSEGTGGPSGSGSLVSNLVVGANDPSFASTFVNSGAQGLDHLNLGVMSQSTGGALLSSSALEMGGSMASHFRSSSPMTIDVADIAHNSLLGSAQLTTIDQSELGLGGLAAGGGGGHHILSRGGVKSSSSSDHHQPLSASASPAGSLQDDDMDGSLYQSVLVDSPLPLSSSSSVLPTLSSSAPPTMSSSAAVPPAAATGRGRGGGGKPTSASQPAKKPGRKKKDPNEPQKPVSAYALFFRDTQAAIKGQNPNASFGEVSKIVASMWDSLAEEQKQVYKRKTELAKKDYLKALAAYRASQLSQPSSGEVADASPSLPPANTTSSSSAPSVQSRGSSAYNPDENTITNICASNIILDVPEVTTRSRTGAKPPAASLTTTTSPPPPATQTITKIIISNPGGAGQVVTVLPSGVRTLQPRQPPPLQQMQSTPPPLPRLQQMAPAPPPPLLAKPGATATAASMAAAATPPPPLQIKIVPPSSAGEATPIIVASSAAAGGGTQSGSPSPKAVETLDNTDDDIMEDEELTSEQVQMELNESSDAGVCVRAGCNNPVIDSDDWDKEYCSNECVADHCRDIFTAWCSIRKQSYGKVK